MEREPLLQEAGRRSYASIPNLLLSHPRIPKEEREQVPDLQPTSLSSKFASLTDNYQSRREERKWRCVIEQIEIDKNTTANPAFLRFAIGGPPTPIKKKKNNFETFQTSVTTGSSKKFRDKFSREFTCTYSDLQNHYLSIELFQAAGFLCSPEKFIGYSHLTLRQLVESSTKQSISLRVDTPDGRQRVTGRVIMRLRFEEILFVKVQLHNWQGMKIPKETIVNHVDISGYPFRHLIFRIGDNPPSSPIVCANPQFPRWRDAVVVSFTGTMVAFQNSVLMAIVYASSSPDTLGTPIGYSALPLISITEVPFIQSPLVRELVEDEEGNRKVVGVENVGVLEGYAYLTSELSMYQQLNPPRTHHSRHLYMVVSVDQVKNLPSGHHDHFFVSAEWRKYVLNSKVYPQQGNVPIPVDEQLHFPMHNVELDDPTSRWSDAALSILIYHCPKKASQCRCYVGGFDVDMKAIITASITGNRKFRADLPLYNLGKKLECDVVFTVWFEPHLPNDILNPHRHKIGNIPASSINSSVDEEYELLSDLRAFDGVSGEDNVILSLEAKWKQQIPKRFLNKFKDRYFAQIEDETGKSRFLPTYLVRFPPSPDFNTPTLVAQTVQRIHTDESILPSSDKFEKWYSPNCLIRSGVAPYSAQVLLHANFLLGLGLDTYVCIGSNKEGNTRLWILTRDDNGAITFWVTSTGHRDTFSDRWQGKDISMKNNEFLSSWKDFDIPVLYSKDKDGNHIFNFYQDDPIVQPYPIETKEEVQYDSSEEEEEEEEEEEATDKLPKSIFFVFNHQNIWANIQIMDPTKIKYDLDNKRQWIPFFGKLDFHQSVDSHWGIPFYTMKHLSPPIPHYLSLATVATVQEHLCSSITRHRISKGMQTRFEESLIPELTEILKLRQELLDNSIENDEFSDKILAIEQQLDSKAPEGYSINQTKVFHFKHFDPVRITMEIMERLELHEENNSPRFVVACLLAPYHNMSCSLWIGIIQLLNFQ